MENKVYSAKIYTNDFNRIISATKAFVAKNGTRKVHQYIKLEFNAENQRVTAIAVDGYRMSVEHSIISDCENDFIVYIKPTVALPKSQYATFSLDGNEAVVRCGGFMFGYEQPQAVEFDWQKAIPQGEPSLKIGFNGNYLLTALQAAKSSVGNSFRSPVVLEFRSPFDPVILKTNGDDIKMVLPVRIKG